MSWMPTSMPGVADFNPNSNRSPRLSVSYPASSQYPDHLDSHYGRHHLQPGAHQTFIPSRPPLYQVPDSRFHTHPHPLDDTRSSRAYYQTDEVDPFVGQPWEQVRNFYPIDENPFHNSQRNPADLPHPLPNVHRPVSRRSPSATPSDLPSPSRHRSHDLNTSQFHRFPSVPSGGTRKYIFEEDPWTEAIQNHAATAPRMSRYRVQPDSFRSLNFLELADPNHTQRRSSVDSAEDPDAEGEVDEDYVSALPPNHGPQGTPRHGVEPVATDASSIDLYKRYMEQKHGKDWSRVRGAGGSQSHHARALGQ